MRHTPEGAVCDLRLQSQQHKVVDWTWNSNASDSSGQITIRAVFGPG